MPAKVVAAAAPGLADHTVTAATDRPDEPIAIGFVIGRPLVDRLTVYVVALLPLLLAVVLAGVWVERRQRPGFDLAFAAGLIGAMLAILPLRAVLVPHELDSVALTLVDDILVLGVLFIAAFLFWQYARFATRARDQEPTPPTRG